MKYKIIFLLLISLTINFCNKNVDSPVYVLNQSVLINGSLYYNEAGCVRCHGISYKGDGPEAKTLETEKSLIVPNFVRALPSKTTPLDYFKVITMGTEKFKEHAYQNYTDRGRWAMANYLYNLSLPPESIKDKDVNQERNLALKEMMKQVEEVYSKTRRWEMGYTPIDNRPQSPKLEELLPKNFK